MDVTVSLGLAPGPQLLDLAPVAEECGIDRVWLFDSPALYQDIWIWLARLGATTSLNLGTAVLVPGLRHVLTTASAMASLQQQFPGRLACAVGTGSTARWMLGQKAATWDATRREVEQLKALLRGEVVEAEGAAVQLIQGAAFSGPRPVDVPVLIAASGSRGEAIAAEVADGIVTTGPTSAQPQAWHARMVNGTVLDPAEDRSAARLIDVVGPWWVLGHHMTWQLAGDRVDRLVGGAAWRADVEAARSVAERHLTVHEGHIEVLNGRDRRLATSALEGLAGTGWVDHRDGIRARAHAAVEEGVTELIYTPCGPDRAREIRAFCEALRD